jgi:uncharacterized protein
MNFIKKKSRSKHFGIALILIILVLVGFSFKRHSTVEVSKVKIGNAVVNVEVVDSYIGRGKGLMFRERLNKDTGMLFIFPNEKKHPFWMANTLISLDIIWINSDYEIVYINENTPPCGNYEGNTSDCPVYNPDSKAKYVLEVNAGWVKRNKVEVGNTTSGY